MKVLFLFSPFFFLQFLAAQSAGIINADGWLKDDSALSEQVRFIYGFYESRMKNSNEILNGREYEYYFYPQISSPLIPVGQQHNSSIVIKGKKFEGIMLKYDTYKDLVVYFDPSNLINSLICPVIINKYIIDEFDIELSNEKLKFVYLKIKGNEKLKSGFYEMVYEGKSKFIIKHSSNKFIREGRDNYDYKTIPYVVNSTGYYRIRGIRSLLKVFSDHVSEVRKFIKSSNISVRYANKNQISEILKFYDNYQLP